MALPTLLLTRPRHSARAFADTLDAKALAAVRLLFAPLIEISALKEPVKLDEGDVVIFTSANGVMHGPDGDGRTAFCVGLQTTIAANASGWAAQQVGDTARQLVQNLRQSVSMVPLVHLGGTHTRGDIAKNLTAAGLKTRHIAVYDQNLQPLGTTALDALHGPCIIPVFSPRTATQLVGEARGRLGHGHIIALSSAVADAFCGENIQELSILDKPQAVYMRKAVENLCLTITLP